MTKPSVRSSWRQVFAIHTGDNVIYTNYQNPPGGTWNGWFSMGNAGTMFYYGQP